MTNLTKNEKKNRFFSEKFYQKLTQRKSYDFFFEKSKFSKLVLAR